MRITFPIEKTTYREYCPNCHTEGPFEVVSDGGFTCMACSEYCERLIIIDPKLRWWLDDDGVYYHESVGMLIVCPDDKILFYELTKYPYGLTIPAGHVDAVETSEDAAIREGQEEVGLTLHNLVLIAQDVIHGDKCRRGCDDHKWSLYISRVSDDEARSIELDAHEGKDARWLRQDDAKDSPLPPAVRFIFDTYGDRIKEAIHGQAL